MKNKILFKVSPYSHLVNRKALLPCRTDSKACTLLTSRYHKIHFKKFNAKVVFLQKAVASMYANLAKWMEVLEQIISEGWSK